MNYIRAFLAGAWCVFIIIMFENRVFPWLESYNLTEDFAGCIFVIVTITVGTVILAKFFH